MSFKYEITATIVLYHEDIEMLQRTVGSFLKIPFKKKLFLVDNSATCSLSSFFIHKEIEYIFPEKNIGFGKAHNIVINEDSGFAYAVGTSTFSGGPHFVDINDPQNPVAAGGFSGGGYSHDAQVVTYKGPDTDYTDKEILIGSNANQVVIVDVTDKLAPITISTITYQNIGYTHQGWFTENQKYFILGDELDERDFGGNTRALVFDFTDLDNPIFHTEYIGTTAAIDHNGYTKGNIYFQANYTAGVRMIDLSNIEAKNLTEIGSFDTYPENDLANFKGTWNVYPYFPSGNIIISDINRGFFIIRKSGS